MTNSISKNLVFIDGITRCGKSLFSGIIPSFENMEHIQFHNQLELIIPTAGLGAIDLNFAKKILNLSLTELAYNLQLSRNVNFRGEDQTGIYNYKDPDVYINRLSLNEGDEIIEFILSNNIHIPFQTHDLMVNLDVLNCMDLDYKMIELLRNPIDNLYSWWIKGLGERFSNDIREFTLPVEYKGFSFPWYCHGYEEEVIDLNPYERCIKIGINLIERSIDQYKNSKNKDKIIIILFEDMVQNPNYQLNRIEDFLGLQTTKYTNKFISEAKCPRVLNPKDRNDKLSIFKENVSPDLFENLVSLTNSYEKDTYGLV